MGKQVLVFRLGCPTWIDEEDVMKYETIYGWRGMSINAEPKCINDNLIGATAEPMGHRHKTIGDMFCDEIDKINNRKTVFASKILLTPVHIIFNGVTTICIFGDGTKVISRPQKGEKFDKETGVAMCIAKYIYGSRSKFLKAVEKGHQQ